MKYSKVSFGHAEAVFNKLGGEQGISNFLSGRTQVVKSDKDFKAFMTLEIGEYNEYDLIKILKKDKAIETKGSDNVLDWPMFDNLSEKMVLELVTATPVELGFEPMFESCANYKNICERAEVLGLDECPSILGMQLTLPQHRLKDGFYIVASNPLEDRKGKKHLLVPWFNENGCELKAWEVEQDKIFYKDFKFIFVRRNVLI